MTNGTPQDDGKQEDTPISEVADVAGGAVVDATIELFAKLLFDGF